MHRPRFIEFLLMSLLILGGESAAGRDGYEEDESPGTSPTGTAWIRAVLASQEPSPRPRVARRFEAESAPQSKIRFDLERLDADGLQGPPDGLRALHYEYCIPDHGYAIDGVSAIDPTLQIQRGSPGRVGCGEGELLCLGHTHQPDHRAVLEWLAALPFVGGIREAFFE